MIVRRGLLVVCSILITLLLTLAYVAGSRAAPAAQPARFPAVVKVLQPANVRAGPGTEYEIISGARPGQRLTVIDCNLDCSWYKLAEDCWIAAFLVEPEQPVAISGTMPTVVVSIPITAPGTFFQPTRCPQTNAVVNTYAGPGLFYAVVDTRPAGECVAVVGRNSLGDWFQLSHGMWIAAAAVIYAEPIETMPVTDRIFTATPIPPPTQAPTATPTPVVTPVMTEILTVGEWMIASPEQKGATALLWAQRLVAAGTVTGDATVFAAQLQLCADTTLLGTAEILGPAHPISDVAAGCALVLN